MKELNNLAPFYSGQKVIYVGKNESKRNKSFTIKSCYKQECGCWRVIIVGYDFIVNEDPFVYCCKCYKSIKGGQSVASGRADDFRPLQEQSFPLIKLTKVIEEQPVIAN